MRCRFCLGLLMTLLATSSAAAQEVKSVTEAVNGKGEMILRVRFATTRPLPVAVVGLNSNYTLFEIDTKKLEDAASLTNLTWLVQAAQVDCPAPVTGGYCDLKSGALLARLDPAKTYILGVDNLPGGGRSVITFKLDPTKAKIADPLDADKQRNQFRVAAPAPIQLDPSSTLKVTRDVLKIAPGSLYVLPSSEDVQVNQKKSGQDGDGVKVVLEKNLSEGVVHSLNVTDGIATKEVPPRKVKGSGQIALGGLPSDPDTPKLALTLSSNASVGQKAFFDLTLNYSPENKPSNITSDGIWKPNVAVDVGLRSTKSSNSIILSLLYTKSYWICKKPIVKTKSDEAAEKEEERRTGFTLPELKPCEGKALPAVDDPLLPDGSPLPDGAIITRTYAGWNRTPWHRHSHINFAIGPKLEADRDFKKVNVLGNARFDFIFHRWIGTVAQKRKLILSEDAFADDPKAAAGMLRGPYFGFKLVPYLSFDVGRRAYSETIKKSVAQQVMGKDVTVETSVLVPRQNIARTTAGINSTVEWRTFKVPTTLTLDESLIFLGLRESVGFTTDEGAFLRSLRGFHPRFVTSLDFAIDPSRHYSFNITHQNGRTPPSFEYLNKLTVGFKVVY